MSREEAFKEFESDPTVREAARAKGLSPRSWLERHLDAKYKGNVEEFRRDLDRALMGESDGYSSFGLREYDPLDSLAPPDRRELNRELTGGMAGQLAKAREIEAALKAKYPEGKSNLAFEYEKYLEQVRGGNEGVLNHLRQRRELAGPVIGMLAERAGLSEAEMEAVAKALKSFVSREDAPFKASHWRGFIERKAPFTGEEREKLARAMGGKEKAGNALERMQGALDEFSRAIDANAFGKGNSVEEVHNTQHLTHILGKAVSHLKNGE